MKPLDPSSIRMSGESDPSPCLVGSRCRECDGVVFPRMPVCPACGRNGAMEEVEIGRTGRIYSHTIAHFAPKGFTAPFFQAFIDLPEGPRIFEINPRFSSTVMMRHAIGFSDVAWMLHARAHGTLPPWTPPAPGTRVFHLHRELVARPGA